VDEAGTVERLERSDRDVRLHVTTSPEFAAQLIEKGSVTIDGVALTVVGLRRDGFDTALIPHTLEVTTLGDRRPGDRVNLEADVLGKYVKRHLEALLRDRA
jgi:riboflavin synthase